MKKLLVISLVIGLTFSNVLSVSAKETGSSSKTSASKNSSSSTSKTTSTKDSKDEEDRSIKTVTDKDSDDSDEDMQDEEEIITITDIKESDGIYEFINGNDTVIKISLNDTTADKLLELLGGIKEEDAKEVADNEQYATTQSSDVDISDLRTYASATVTGDEIRRMWRSYKNNNIVIVVQTNALRNLGSDWEDKALNYGGLLSDSNSKAPKAVSNSSITTDGVKSAYVCDFSYSGDEASLVFEDGKSYFTGNLYVDNGNNLKSEDFSSMNVYGSAAYVDSSYKFETTLIRNTDGSIIGVFFKQLDTKSNVKSY